MHEAQTPKIRTTTRTWVFSQFDLTKRVDPMDSEQKIPAGFAKPTDLPSEQQTSQWQAQNRAWWQKNPMRYDWNDRIPAEEFSRAFYEEIDRRFFEDAAHYAPPVKRPFDALIPFDSLASKDVLEIGVGNGSHAQLLAPHCRSYTGIDLTDHAVTSTTRRFELFGINGRIHQMDAEKLEFPDDSFDFIWTWGVIHHSANTDRILAQMHRVLRPGGTAVVMVYHRSFWYFYGLSGFFRGVLQGGLLKTRSLHKLVQLHTDGAIARFYTPAQWRDLVHSKGFRVVSQRIMGVKAEILPLPPGALKRLLMRWTPDALTRLVLNRLRQGSFLITTLAKVPAGT
jgi:ubiquinone/menaquinone biosynthesis C-methylase UbiE